jgi:hypothetical protein
MLKTFIIEKEKLTLYSSAEDIDNTNFLLDILGLDLRVEYIKGIYGEDIKEMFHVVMDFLFSDEWLTDDWENDIMSFRNRMAYILHYGRAPINYDFKTLRIIGGKKRITRFLICYSKTK